MDNNCLYGYLCYYCVFASPLQQCVDHMVESHGHLPLKVKLRSFDENTGLVGYTSRDFGFVPNNEIGIGQFLEADEGTCIVCIVQKTDETEEIADLEISLHNMSLDDGAKSKNTDKSVTLGQYETEGIEDLEQSLHNLSLEFDTNYPQKTTEKLAPLIASEIEPLHNMSLDDDAKSPLSKNTDKSVPLGQCERESLHKDTVRLESEENVVKETEGIEDLEQSLHNLSLEFDTNYPQKTTGKSAPLIASEIEPLRKKTIGLGNEDKRGEEIEGIDALEISLHNMSLDFDAISPLSKKTKTSTPIRPTERESLRTVNTNENEEKDVEQIKLLVPKVVDEMKRTGNLQTWIDFHKMVHDEQFPLENIAFRLFMDVCRFYACANTCEMKYSDTVKRFWRIGYKLFHGKWLKFMSGPKHTGKIVTQDSERGSYKPEDGAINFSVPIHSVTSGKLAPVSGSDIQPGILSYMIEKVSEKADQTKTYKLCLDGKKINAATNGKHGDIDLWGYEHTPSLSERKESLEAEIKCIEKVNGIVTENIDDKKETSNDLTNMDKDTLRHNLLTVISNLSKRVQTLRQMNVSKERMKEKLMLQAGENWKKSRLAFVISAIITSIYDIKSCIKNILQIIDEACQVIACLNGVPYVTDTTINISKLHNYMHLTGLSSQARFVKQRSELWKEFRSLAVVTGSTLYDALGLRSLKNQTAHFDQVVSHIQKPEPTEQVKTMMKHGSENEIHATATIAGKVLPVLNPEVKLYEEGCYPVAINGVPTVVSPDCSCRCGIDTPPTHGVEIKCPFPGNKYSTPVSYNIAKYYVPQVLSEMFALGAEKLYYVSYSSESTAVHEVEFDQSLWNDIETEVKHIYGSAKPTHPARKSENIPIIQKKLDEFVKSKSTFLMEVPSVRAADCQHCSVEIETGDSTFCINSSVESNHETNTELKSVLEILYNAEQATKQSYQLTRHKASEFLGFMISDTDRNFHPELLHSVPIAYGLKGYSLPTSILRTMIEDVLHACAKQGLYVPICSFDGQWSRIAVRDRNDKPLTVLQLQKDVFHDAKQLSKSELIRKMSNCNIVEAESLDGLLNVADVTWEKRANMTTNEIENYIEVKGKKGESVYTISKQTHELIKKNVQTCIHNEIPDIGVEDNILNTIADSVIDQISPEIAEDINSLSNSHANFSSMTPVTNNDINGECESNSMHVDEEIGGMHVDGEIAESTTRNEDPNIAILNDNHYQSMLDALNEDHRCTKSDKWKLSLAEFKLLFLTAKSIDKAFLAYELNICIRQVIGILRAHKVKLNLSASKQITVNTLSEVLGDGSFVDGGRKKKTVTKLKSLSKAAEKKLKKEHLNIIEAEHSFPTRLDEWYADNPFGRYIEISSVDCSKQNAWYSRPEMNDELGHHIFTILDAYHQICGARRLFCLKGIPAAGIYTSRIHRVADESEQNGCGLRSAMVTEPMLDKQSVAYAVATFSEKVQRALNEIGAHNEAEFCELIREWYKAEDEPSISAKQRCESRMKLRAWLLNNVNFGVFPPSGAYVKDIPIVLFEGLLTGIERRIQLFSFVKSGTYNVRAIGSLDIENFFGGFQDIDPWGTGVLRPDGIATAIGVAVELTEARMNPDRGFHMMTSSAKVYPCNSYEGMDTDDIDCNACTYGQLRNLSPIVVRDHYFDTPDRSRGKRKRKLGNISRPEDPVRRPTTVREFHKAHESKILHHVRRGLRLDHN